MAGTGGGLSRHGTGRRLRRVHPVGLPRRERRANLSPRLRSRQLQPGERQPDLYLVGRARPARRRGRSLLADIQQGQETPDRARALRAPL